MKKENSKNTIEKVSSLIKMQDFIMKNINSYKLLFQVNTLGQTEKPNRT